MPKRGNWRGRKEMNAGSMMKNVGGDEKSKTVAW